MESKLEVLFDGNMYWHDVLRCADGNGFFAYFSQYDTSSELVYSGKQKVSQWYYRGDKPDYPTQCQMYSTITRKLPYGIEKKETIKSRVFQVI